MILVHRKHKPDCVVSIMYDRHTGKYCFVNLTSNHVCSCRFDTEKEALEDLSNNENVISYEEINIGIVDKESSDIMTQLNELEKEGYLIDTTWAFMGYKCTIWELCNDHDASIEVCPATNRFKSRLEAYKAGIDHVNKYLLKHNRQ